MRDVTIKDIPLAISDAKVLEWNAVLIERFHNQKATEIPEVLAAVKVVQTGIDSFRTANSLAAKFSAKPVEVI